MKKRIGSLLLILALCFTLLPTAAFAEENEQSSKISITTVDELLQFAKAVDNGEYDNKTDAVVSLDADLDLTDVTWKPIGSVFDGDGNLLHYFSGKFYGNGIRFPIWIFPRTTERQSIRFSDFSAWLTALKFPV